MASLEHYLDVLSHKPGAFAGSKPLAQWREAGRWPACYDELWDRLRARHGKQNGTRAMVAVLALGREFGQDRLHAAVPGGLTGHALDVCPHCGGAMLERGPLPRRPRPHAPFWCDSS